MAEATHHQKILDDLRELVEGSRRSNQMLIPLPILEAYLNEATHNQANAYANYQHDMKVFEIQAPLENARQLEMFKATLETGQTAIKSLTLINGGACLAMLTFIGSLATKEVTTETIQLETLLPALMIFAGGVGAAGFTSASRYFSQDWYNRNDKVGDIFKWIGIAAGLSSLLLFFVGCYSAGEALLYPTTTQ